jgi:hypothetical protein
MHFDCIDESYNMVVSKLDHRFWEIRWSGFSKLPVSPVLVINMATIISSTQVQRSIVDIVEDC